ncbi:hypothetical protein Ancab_011981 [Ancistrocladus abbreviatus]
MVVDPQNSDPVDPLTGYSKFSLLPSTFKGFTIDHRPGNEDENDMGPIHAHFKTMELRSDEKLQEQAKTILDGSSDILDPNNKPIVVCEDKNEPVAPESKRNPPQRRPALGRKRPQFSLKQTSSQPVVSLELNVDIDKLQNPDEYFSAIEKLENAKKEIRRQRGMALKDLDQNIPFVRERPRRPGLLGKSASYKHHYSMGSSTDKLNLLSQESSMQDIHNPFGDSIQPKADDANISSKGGEMLDKCLTATVEEDKVNNLFDELLSGNYEDLEGDKALNLLQEHLQIKPMDLGKICLPDLPIVRPVETSEKTLPELRDSLVHLQDMMISIKTPTECNQMVEDNIGQVSAAVARSSFMSLSLLENPILLEARALRDKSRPPKSPLASISLLKKRIAESTIGNDPFSDFDIDLSPARNSSGNEQIDKQFNQDDTENKFCDSERLKSPVLEKESIAVAPKGSHELAAGNSAMSATPVEDITRAFCSGLDTTALSISICNVVDNDTHNDIDGCCDEAVGNTSEPTQLTEQVPEMELLRSEPDLQGCAMKKSNGCITDESNAATLEHVTDEPSNMQDRCNEQSIERSPEASKIKLRGKRKVKAPSHGHASKMTVDKGREEKATQHGQRKRKEHSHEQSLAEESTTMAINHEIDEPSSSVDGCHEQSVERNPRAFESEPRRRSKENELSQGHISETIMDERRETKAAPQGPRKRKGLPHRQSLAAAGMKWESGLRRSTRIRMRPLEYWKGERMLYGRIHESLVTVIGMKYFSPSKDGGEPKVKVQSFVSDEHKELVELVALH